MAVREHAPGRSAPKQTPSAALCYSLNVPVYYKKNERRNCVNESPPGSLHIPNTHPALPCAIIAKRPVGKLVPAHTRYDVVCTRTTAVINPTHRGANEAFNPSLGAPPVASYDPPRPTPAHPWLWVRRVITGDTYSIINSSDSMLWQRMESYGKSIASNTLKTRTNRCASTYYKYG